MGAFLVFLAVFGPIALLVYRYGRRHPIAPRPALTPEQRQTRTYPARARRPQYATRTRAEAPLGYKATHQRRHG
jgi:hypothetical protein